MLGHSKSDERLGELRDLTFRLPSRQFRDLIWRRLSFEQCDKHPLSRDSEHIAQYTGDLHVCMLQQFLNTVSLARAILHQLHTPTGQITQFTGGSLPFYLKGMGQDANGEIYITTATALGPSGTSGTVQMLVPEPASLGLLATGALVLLRRRKR